MLILKKYRCLVSAPELQFRSNGLDGVAGACCSFNGVLGLAGTFSFLVLLLLGVLVLAGTFFFLALLFLGVLVLAGTFSFLALFGFGCAGGGSSESYIVSLQVFFACVLTYRISCISFFSCYHPQQLILFSYSLVYLLPS